VNDIISKLAEEATYNMGFDSQDFMLQTSNGEITYEIPAEFIKAFANLLINECASRCDPEPGLKYSPNAKSSREDCKEKILQLIG
jgi:hypothetical protein